MGAFWANGNIRSAEKLAGLPLELTGTQRHCVSVSNDLLELTARLGNSGNPHFTEPPILQVTLGENLAGSHKSEQAIGQCFEYVIFLVERKTRRSFRSPENHRDFHPPGIDRGEQSSVEF